MVGASNDCSDNINESFSHNTDSILNHDKTRKNESNLPVWKYHLSDKDKEVNVKLLTKMQHPPVEGPLALDLGSYCRTSVGNCVGLGKQYFDLGLRLMLSYQHELASASFYSCLHYSPNCALAHGLIALCHSPNYNFKGEAYYYSACHYDDVHLQDVMCVFPSQQVADRHSKRALETIEELRRVNRSQSSSSSSNSHHHSKKKGKGCTGGSGGTKNKKNRKKSHNGGSSTFGTSIASESTNIQENGSDVVSNSRDDNNQSPTANVVTDDDTLDIECTKDDNNDNDESMISLPKDVISDIESQLLHAIRILTRQPGVDPGLSEEIVGRPFADAMAKVYAKYPNDPDIAYFYAESLMVLNAWQLYEYPSGKAASPDVNTAKTTLETVLRQHPHHAGLCHMYVHLCEMSSNPSQALIVCETLRYAFPHGGHLVHMATHIDVLVGDYDKCVTYNIKAKEADAHVMEIHPAVAGPETFYFGYIAHNYHMGVYGAILGGYEQIAMDLASEINLLVNEQTFEEHPDLVAYLETYASLEIHVMIRFGRWKEILNDVELPNNDRLMLYRTSQIRYGRALAHAMLGNIDSALYEAKQFDALRHDPDAPNRILHNNTVADLLELDSVMMHGELLYKAGKYNEGLALLKKAVTMQDNLNYDEPWGKMQPTRHAYGGLLCEQGFIDEAISVFRTDLKLHPNNPWALVGLIDCLTKSKRCHTAFDATVTCTVSYDTVPANGSSSNPVAVPVDSVNATISTTTCCNIDNSHVPINNATVDTPKTNKKKKNKKSTISNTAAVPVQSAVVAIEKEIEEIKEALRKQRLSKYADYDIAVSCECCIRK